MLCIVHGTLKRSVLNNGCRSRARFSRLNVLRPSVTVDVQAVALARGVIDEQRAVH